ncbi:MAG: hypothetical protein ABF904_13170 [Ethanoligenens sp.]
MKFQFSKNWLGSGSDFFTWLSASQQFLAGGFPNLFLPIIKAGFIDTLFRAPSFYRFAAVPALSNAFNPLPHLICVCCFPRAHEDGPLAVFQTDSLMVAGDFLCAAIFDAYVPRDRNGSFEPKNVPKGQILRALRVR